MSSTITTTLANLVEVKYPAQSFFLNTLYKRVVVSDNEQIAIDKVIEGEQLARFVACCADGVARANPEFSTTFFRPAYMQEIGNLLSCGNLQQRCPGEPLNGGWSADMRLAYYSMEMQARQQTMFQRRFEWMAVRAAVDAKYTVSGDGVPTYEVNFGRDAGNTITVSAGLWTVGNSKPLADIRAATDKVLNGCGMPADLLVLGVSAYNALVAHNDINDIIVNNGFTASRLLSTEFAVAMRGAEYKGRLGSANGIEVWMYSDRYKDEAGAYQEMFPTNKFMVVSTMGYYGTRAHGAINIMGQLGGVEVFTQQYPMPGGKELRQETLSNALMIAGNPNATSVCVVTA